MKYYVYLTTKNDDPTKQYIGTTINSISTGYKGSGIYIQKAIKKYGADNFTRVNLEICEHLEIARDYEWWYVQHYKTETKYGGYNISPDGGFRYGGNHSEETKKKISEAHKGKPGGNKGKKHSEGAKKRMSEAQKGRRYLDAIKKRMIITQKRNATRKLNKFLRSEELRKQLIESMRGRMPEETRKKLSIAHKGKIHSEETKRKMSEAQKGRIVLEITRKRMSISARFRQPKLVSWNG